MNKLVEILYEVLLEDKVSNLKAQFVDSKKISKQEFDRLITADPTGIKYLIWIVSRYYNDVVKPNEDKPMALMPAKKRFFEDLYKITDGLATFDRFKRKFKNQDIFKYNLEDFKKEAFEVEQNLNAAEKEVGKQKSEKYPEFKIGEVDGFTVYKLPQGRLDLKPVSCDLGSGTNWCTSKANQNYYDSYVKKDPLFIFIKGNEKYQFHFKDNQFMDKQDHSMKDGELKDNFLAFLKNKEGRMSGNQSIENHKIKDVTIGSETYPLYQVGNKLYTKIEDKVLFYDTEIGGGQGFKLQDGTTLPFKQALKHPYMDMLKYVYTTLDSKEKRKFPGIYRILLNLDLEGETLPTIPSLDVSNTDLSSLPDGLNVAGNVDLTGTKITKLPKNFKVGGEFTDVNGKKTLPK